MFAIMQIGAIATHVTYAEPMPDTRQLIGQILLDNSSEAELIISNINNDETVSDAQTDNTRIRPGKLHWKSGAIPYQAEVQAAARITNMDPALIHAVIAAESGYNPRAQSKKGAYGLMQVLPATARSLTSVPVKQWSANQQILWGSRYLKQMLNMFEGDMSLALAAYNAGPNAVKTHHNTFPPFAETRQYVPKVLSYYRSFKLHLPNEKLTIEH